jgi:hypothetical protein
VQPVERTDDRGVIAFDWGTCTLRASPDGLDIQIEAADDAALTRARALIGHQDLRRVRQGRLALSGPAAAERR